MMTDAELKSLTRRVNKANQIVASACDELEARLAGNESNALDHARTTQRIDRATQLLDQVAINTRLAHELANAVATQCRRCDHTQLGTFTRCPQCDSIEVKILTLHTEAQANA